MGLAGENKTNFLSCMGESEVGALDDGYFCREHGTVPSCRFQKLNLIKFLLILKALRYVILMAMSTRRPNSVSWMTRRYVDQRQR